jgi:hypothetical protein
MKRSDIPRADQVAITVACATAALVIVTFLVSKTPNAIIFLMTCLFLCISYPIVRFVRSIRLKIVALILCVVAVSIFGKSVWPKINSELRVVEAAVHPFEVNKPASLNLRITNDGSETIQANHFDLISITLPVTSMEDEIKVQEEKWEVLRKFVAEASPISSPYPPKYLNWRTITDPKAILTQAHVDALQTGSGLAIRFMSVMQYTDETGEHETDFCVTVQKPDALWNCQHHNGPAEPMKHR